MDVNGTRFRLVLGHRDFEPLIGASYAPENALARWTAATGGAAAVPAPPLEWDSDWDGVRLMRQLPLLAAPADARLLQPADRRGADADAFGNIFWIARDRAGIRLRPAGIDADGDYWSVAALAAERLPAQGVFSPAAPSGAPRVPELSGLAVTRTRYLVAGTRSPGGLLIFDLDSSGQPRWWRWPEAVGFAPFDLAATADGGVVMLDRPAGAAARIWRLDRNFAVVDLSSPLLVSPARQEAFHPEGAAPRAGAAEPFGGPVEIGAASPLEADDPVALAELPDRSVLVLDAGAPGAPCSVQRWRGAQLSNIVVLDAAATRPHLNEALTAGHDFALLADAGVAPGTMAGWLYLATAGAAQVFALRFTGDGEQFGLALEPLALPLQRFGGKALVAAGTKVFYDSSRQNAAAERWVALAEQPRYRYFPEAMVEGSAAQEVLFFDSSLPQCVWHRVLLDACIPAGCGVLIESRASDDRTLLDGLDWQAEPIPYRRAEGSELPFDRPFGQVAANDLRLGTFETLLQAATGRYLALRLTLRGDGRASPRLRALRVYYPRFSYLREYLPAVFRGEDAGTAGFLERFLCNPEGIYTAVEGRVAQAEVLFDPAVAPAELLPWLAGWLGAMLEENWDETRRRLFLRYAWLLFRWRGTPLGLLTWLRLATESCVDESLFSALEQGGYETAPRYGGSRLRLVEGFELRELSGAPLPGANSPAPAVDAPGLPWQANQGGAALHARYAQFLRQRYGAGDGSGDAAALQALSAAWQLAEPLADFAQLRFSAVLPAEAAKAADWRSFAQTAFAFRYPPVRGTDAARYREFLARRYGFVDALNHAYGLGGAQRWASFAAVGLPPEDTLPADGAPLDDWIQFVSLALPIAREAHRFFVLVPASPSEPPAQRDQRVAQVETLVRREKPAHTEFEVKLFWALFQAGRARLGIDSVLGDSGRYVAMVLDAGYLGEGYLAEGFPWDAAGRTVVGRDRLQG